jgi:hypothetical protein
MNEQPAMARDKRAAARSNTGFQPVRLAGFQPVEWRRRPVNCPPRSRQAGSPPDAQAGSLCYAASIRLLAPLASFWILLATSALACQVPVFRYALDHWEADRYQLEVPSETARDDAMASFFRNLGTSSPLNLDARPQAGATDARLLFPRSPAVAWQGVLTPEALRRVTNSPARTELVRRLLSGDSAVWVLIETAPESNDVAQRVEGRLRFLENVAQLPRIEPADPDSQLGPGPALKLHFSLLRIASDDPEEATFIRQLAGPEAASGFNQLPALALVFGRGRVLRAGPAESFDDKAIEEASLFLLGACSCRVKRANPGWDLLTAVNWESSLAQAAQAQPAALEATSIPAERLPETVKIAPSPELHALASAIVPAPFAPGWLLGAGAAVLIALATLLLRKARP